MCMNAEDLRIIKKSFIRIKKKKKRGNTLKSALLEVLYKILHLDVVPSNKTINIETTIINPKYPFSYIRCNLGDAFLDSRK